MSMSTSEDVPMSADEIALYDRQIRLWGMQAQANLRGANILLIRMRALAQEVAKNLVLAGIGKLTILDDEMVTEADYGAQFMLPAGAADCNRAEACMSYLQQLNPRVTVSCDSGDVRSKPAAYFGCFNVVIATDIWDPSVLTRINAATRAAGRAFYAAGLHGVYGHVFADLIEHSFVIERDLSNTAGPTRTAAGNQMVSRTCELREQQRIPKRCNDKTGRPMERVTFVEKYSSFERALGARLSSEIYKRRNRLRAVTPALPCIRALFEFASRAAPDPKSSAYAPSSLEPRSEQSQQPAQSKPRLLPSQASTADMATFTRLATTIKQALGLTEELRSEFLRGFLQGVGTEIAAVSAIVGGLLAQDVINVLSATQQPIQNMLIFDGNVMEASVFSLHPDGELGRAQPPPDEAASVTTTTAGDVAADPAPPITASA